MWAKEGLPPHSDYILTLSTSLQSSFPIFTRLDWVPLAEMIDTMQSNAGIHHPFLTSGAKIGIDLNDKFGN